MRDIDILSESWAKLSTPAKILIVWMVLMSFGGGMVLALWFGWNFGEFLSVLND